jgi:putative hydrolase of the HAD superfamily
MKGIFFDLDNTLIDRASAFEGYLQDLVLRFPGVFRDRAAQVSLRQLDDAGLRDRPSFCRLAAERYPGVWRSPAEVWQDFAAGLTRAVEFDPRVVAMVERLADRFTLAVVTNGSALRQREKLSRARLDGLFASVVISEEVGVEKPDPEIFRRALAATGLAAEEVLFVGDDPQRDVAGAQGAGMRTCWVSHHRAYPPGPPRPSLFVTAVEELERVLPGLR